MFLHTFSHITVQARSYFELVSLRKVIALFRNSEPFLSHCNCTSLSHTADIGLYSAVPHIHLLFKKKNTGERNREKYHKRTNVSSQYFFKVWTRKYSYTGSSHLKCILIFTQNFHNIFRKGNKIFWHIILSSSYPFPFYLTSFHFP
jgi:hypothetical protein